MTVPSSFRFPEDLKRDLEKVALEERRTLSWIVIEALRQFVTWRKRQKK